MLKKNWFVFENIDKLSEQLASGILQIADSSIKSNNIFKIVLTGGTSITNTYKILRDSKSDWEKWHIYLSDERCFPNGHKDRNDQMIKELWLNNGKIPKNNIHFINTELGLFEAIDEYSVIVKKIDKFDVVYHPKTSDNFLKFLI